MAKRGFFRDFLGVLNSNIVSLVSALLMVVVLTRVLGTEGYGEYNALIVIPLIVVSLTHLGIRGASIYLLGNKKYDENHLVSSVVLILMGSGLAGMLLSAIAFWLFQENTFSVWLIVLVLFVIPLRLSIIYTGGIFLGKDEIKKANDLNWMINVLNLILAIVLVWWLDLGLTGAVVATLMANLYVSIKAIVLLTKEFTIRLVFHLQIVKSLVGMGILFSLSFFVLQLNYKIDILLLERFSTIEEVGLYSLATQVAEQLWQIPVAISIVLFSRMANKEDSASTESVLVLARLTLLLVLFIALMLFIVAPFIIPFVFGQSFYPSSTMLQVILPGIIFMTVFRVLNGQLEGIGKPYVTLFFFIPALLINIILNILWIPDHGGIGAAMASNVSYIIGVLGYWLFYSSMHNISRAEILHFRKSDFKNISQFISKFKS